MNRTQNLKTRKQFLTGLTLLGAGALLGSLSDCSANNYEEESLYVRKTAIPNDPKLDLIRYAVLAPSSHNSQPWKFGIEGNTIRIYPDFNRRLPIVDPKDRELYISIGCALENLVISAKSLGYQSEVEYFPADEKKECIRIRLSNLKRTVEDPLFLAIPKRQSTRNEYNGKAVPTSDLPNSNSKHSKIKNELITDKDRIESITEWIREGDRIQIADDSFVMELKNWIRFNEKEALQKGDGLLTLCSGGPSIPTWIGNIVFSLVLSGDTQGDTDARLTRSSSGIVIFTSEEDDRNDWIETGRAYERWTLSATSRNIKSAFMNQPIEVPKLRDQLRSRLNIGKNFPQLVARYGYSAPMPYSPRRSLKEILIQSEADSTT